ncbi:hypothetical protein SAMN05216551_11554 [Chitinasiproducens palmae]|uniref:Ankyrin repeat domain-containing protein n=2 Tax=Chitinasiproducens palmae TaxID=1770053 RepID=A0A1H2PW52_9BURK|nr:hypothetical protein SAMN05216551_11554 [Chitinasiproducens palmae]
MKTLMQSICLPASAVILAVSLIVGGLLAASPGNGGFFPGLGAALGMQALGAGNCLSFFLNAVCWGSGFRPRWLRLLLLIQAVPALFYAGWAVSALWTGGLEQSAYAQRRAIEDAIGKDDLPALLRAREACSKRCQALSNQHDDLLVATWASSHHVATYLVGRGARVSVGNWYPSQTDLRTCEGSYIPNPMPLSVAVAKRDMDMMRLLLPVSDAYARSEALQLAARLDRLDLVTFLSSNGIPLQRGGPGQRGDHLLVAAASGAAMHVGKWLLTAQPVAIEHAEMQKATEALYAFMDNVQVARSLDFARMLKANGADFNAAFRGEPSFLDEAIRTKRKDIAQVLLAVGVDSSRLSPARVAALSELLHEPDKPFYNARTEGCFETGV